MFEEILGLSLSKSETCPFFPRLWIVPLQVFPETSTDRLNAVMIILEESVTIPGGRKTVSLSIGIGFTAPKCWFRRVGNLKKRLMKQYRVVAIRFSIGVIQEEVIVPFNCQDFVFPANDRRWFYQTPPLIS
jgi:hypothetical protein